MQRLNDCYARGADWLAAWVGPFTLLFLRIWVALAFWHAGLVKLEDPMGTRFLFNTSDFSDHKILGLMLLVVIAWGGRLSLEDLHTLSTHRMAAAPSTRSLP